MTHSMLSLSSSLRRPCAVAALLAAFTAAPSLSFAAPPLPASQVSAQPAPGRFYQVAVSGPRSVTTIAKAAGIDWRWIEASAWNRARYFDATIQDNLRPNGGLSMAARFAAGGSAVKPLTQTSTGSAYPLLWLPAAAAQEPGASNEPEPAPPRPAAPATDSPARRLFRSLPSSWPTFLATVNGVAEQVDLPSIHRSTTTSNPQFDDPVEIKSLARFAEINVYGHFQRVRQATAGTATPAWLSELEVVLAQPGAASIDLPLAFTIAMREAGSNNLESGSAMADTYGKSGLDFLYEFRNEYVKTGLVPESWIKSPAMERSDPTEKTARKGAAKIPERRLMAFAFAAVGRSQNELSRKVGRYYLDADTARGTSAVHRLAPLERRIWVALCFGGPGGDQNLATVKTSKVGVLTFLQAFRDAGLGLEHIRDIPAAVRARRSAAETHGSVPSAAEETALSFLERVVDIHRLNIATKTAISAQAIAGTAR